MKEEFKKTEQVNFRISKKNKDLLQQLADYEETSIGNLINVWIKQKTKEINTDKALR